MTVPDPGISFRCGGPADVVDVLEFWKRAAEDAHRPADTSSTIESLVRRDAEALIVALIGDEIVGTVIAGFDGWRCHIYRLAVAPGHRQKGIGAELVRRAELRFEVLGGTRSDAMVLDDNHLAHHGWRAWGYSRQLEWRRWVKPLASR
ncbi:MAG: GNAT family N-acetyltransferase [Acidothermaceae bacterium]